LLQVRSRNSQFRNQTLTNLALQGAIVATQQAFAINRQSKAVTSNYLTSIVPALDEQTSVQVNLIDSNETITAIRYEDLQAKLQTLYSNNQRSLDTIATRCGYTHSGISKTGTWLGVCQNGLANGSGVGVIKNADGTSIEYYGQAMFLKHINRVRMLDARRRARSMRLHSRQVLVFAELRWLVSRMRYLRSALILTASLFGLTSTAAAQSAEIYQPATNTYQTSPDQQSVINSNTLGDTPIQAAQSQEFCITVMSGFPDDGHLARYQFFRLTEELATGATPAFTSAINHYAEGDITDDTPILDVIEDIANPVLRQAAPELAIANMAHLIDFTHRCESYVSGQITSLRSFDNTLVHSDVVIQEDALYLRQVLSDSLFRLDANTDSVHGLAVTDYSNSLILMRDNIEFASYNADIDELEALYMVDLDGRLARSNDLINSEINRETLGDAVTLSDDMDEAEQYKRKQSSLRTLFRILNGY